MTVVDDSGGYRGWFHVDAWKREIWSESAKRHRREETNTLKRGETLVYFDFPMIQDASDVAPYRQ